tara:strand:- start:2352 stop:3194 length:843 start_codon:yes stop_codon:yes gene_type:complete
MNKIVSFLVLSTSIIYSQWFYIDQSGVTRSYYVSYPKNAVGPTPLIINMHGYGDDAMKQRLYSEMDQFAHSKNIAVVYPEGLNKSWNVFTFWDANSHDDVEFIRSMMDDIFKNFDIDSNKVYACGMSNGGYMSYRLACDLSDKIAAFGSVTGNFMVKNIDPNDCLDQNREIPIIHFHGTNDREVSYYPPSIDQSLTPIESIDFWSDYNNLTLESIESINNNVEIYSYYNESSIVKFVHYKVHRGGHEWFGSTLSTDWGFNTSEELVKFFLQYKLSDFINN